MIVHDKIIQGTPEWDALRKWRLTGSHASAIGNVGKGLVTYVNSKMCGIIVPKENYVNKDMERGNRLEPLARLEYQLKTGREILEVGFVEYNDSVGISPDGLFNWDRKKNTIEGGIEIKAKNDENHFQVLKDGIVDSTTFWQIQMNLLVTKAQWWDFVSFNPNFKESCKIIRILPDESKTDKLLKGFDVGEKLMKQMQDSDFFKFEYEKIKNRRVKEMV